MILFERLFNRTFLSIFSYSLALCFTAIIATAKYEESAVLEKKITQQKASIQLHIATAENILIQGGMGALNHWLLAVEKEFPSRFYILNEQYKDLLNRTPPIQIEPLQDLFENQHEFIEPYQKNGVIIGHQIKNTDTQKVSILALIIPQPQPHFFARRTNEFWNVLIWSFIISLLSSGLIAYYLILPIRKLKDITQHLIEGNITVRPPKSLQKRTDDIGQLARDFDRLAHQLQASCEAQQKLLKEISRELRSPLARIQAAVELAQQQADHTLARALTRIGYEGKRLGALVDQLLKIPEISGVNRQPLREKLELLNIIDQVSEEAGFAAHQRNIKIEIVTTIKKATVCTRDNLIKNALTHVLHNAVEHTPNASSITIFLTEEKTSSENIFYVIKVKDEGNGVQERYLSQIFTSFFRVEESKNQGNHTGLGLAIAKSAIEQHGGSIFAENTKPGFMITMRIPAKSKIESISLMTR